MGRLDGKVVIVTGGAGGIGSATCELMAREGASVVVADIPEMQPADLAKRIAGDGGRSVGVEVDIREEDQVDAMVAEALRQFGRLDGLHANAAATRLVISDMLVTEVSRADFEDALAVNVVGTWQCCKAAIPAMIEGGGGSIVATSSGAATHGDVRNSAYGVSKAGVNQLMRTIATQFGKQGIRANTIMPGLIIHEGTAMLPEAFRRIMTGNVLTPDLGGPESIAACAAFLISDESRYITGEAIRVDGGMHAHVPQLAQILADHAPVY